jgi:hypothetical protein
MFMTKKRLFLLTILLIIFALTTTACTGGGLPNGRYEPVRPEMALTIPAIEIKGKNFTMVMAGGLMSQTVKYKYKNGTITFIDASLSGLNLACTYADEILTYGDIEFKKVK